MYSQMRDAIENFNTQFGFEPKISNSSKLKPKSKYIIAGMGGSHLAADLLKIVRPHTDVIIHSNYDLPDVKDIEERLLIASSYSGNTEETIDAYKTAQKKHLSTLVISVGGELIEYAKRSGSAYIELPDYKLEPRMALGLSMKAFLRAIGDTKGLREAKSLEKLLNPMNLEEEGLKLAQRLKGGVPVIYSSSKNAPIAYIWKIKINENTKIPAYMNLIPELNHNEMNGFDAHPSTKRLSERFHFIMLHDPDDDPRIQKRMIITAELYKNRGFPVVFLDLTNRGLLKIFSSVVVADWTSFYLAHEYGIEPSGVPMVEEFKKLIA